MTDTDRLSVETSEGAQEMRPRTITTPDELGRELGLKTMALTGRDGGSIGAAADLHINVPDYNTARVQEVHRTIMHAMCELIERE